MVWYHMHGMHGMHGMVGYGKLALLSPATGRG